MHAGNELLRCAHNDKVVCFDRYEAGRHKGSSVLFSVRKNGQCFTYFILLIFLVSIQGCVTNPSNINSKVDEGTFIEKSSSLPFLGLPAPTSVEDALKNGDQAYKASDFNRALFEYVRALDLDDKNPAIYVKIGNAHVKMKNNGVAHLAFNESLKLDANHIAALESMGNLFLRNNKIPEAKVYLEKAINLYEAGMQKADAALVFPISAYTSMGIAMDMENDTQKATDYYYKALDKAPYSYSIHNNIGYSYYLSGAWAEAERFYARAIELNNKYVLAWKNLGLLYARQDRFMESMNAFEQVMEKSQAYNDIGYICLIDGKYEEAEVFLIKAIDLNTRYYKIAEQNLEKVRWHKQLAEIEKVDSKSSRPKRVV
ncbi:MAG: tetratricopeptide repeat protein, partial [Motiliproteus sp.]